MVVTVKPNTLFKPLIHEGYTDEGNITPAEHCKKTVHLKTEGDIHFVISTKNLNV